MGVKVLVNTKVTNVSETGVALGEEIIKTKNIIWAAGNEASPLLKSLDVKLDRVGRVLVENDLTIKDFPNIFVIGDAANVKNNKGEMLPGIAPVAMQQGKYVAKLFGKNIPFEKRKPFEYLDKGTMATIGKAKAVAKIHKFEFSQYIAWFLWSFVHIFFLITFRNRFRVMAEWIWYYFTSRRGVRLITRRTLKQKTEDVLKT
jgi:NADH dehydrogenase